MQRFNSPTSRYYFFIKKKKERKEKKNAGKILKQRTRCKSEEMKPNAKLRDHKGVGKGRRLARNGTHIVCW